MILLQPSSDWANKYHEIFLERVHQLIVWGYQDICSQSFGSDTAEEEITGALINAIKNRLNRSDLPIAYRRYFVEEEQPINEFGRTGKHRQRLDIVVTNCENQPRPTFVFEAKRLKTRTHTMGKYLGPEGLMCFIKGEYAANDSVAGMLAYLQDKNPDYWERQLKQGLQPSRAKLQLENSLQACQMHADLPHEWETRHQRTHGQPIRILHLFLEFNTA
ncbi:MAG: hypothetical protein IGS03_02085 [Candidatus Sericytochromatia bacterium]|nr:hypothetical protein [Candidatus Sericytochromatia bacterium]